MSFSARIATLSLVVCTLMCDAAIAQARRSEAPAPADVEPNQLGDEILQDALPPHESVVEEAPPVYTEVPRAKSGEPDAAISYEYAAPPGVAPRLQHHPLRTHLENRPRQTPLRTDSWLNRPYALSYFIGAVFLDDPIPGNVGGDPGFTYGARLSWDLGPRFGVETRIAGADAGTRDLVGGADLAPADLFYWDVNWLWYWTGDTRWRPYGILGGGMLDINYYDATAHRYHTTVFAMPFGVGLKYRHSTRIALRVELLDNYAFSSGLQSDMHNLSLTAGMEWRFGGGRQRQYWPWNPSRSWW